MEQPQIALDDIEFVMIKIVGSRSGKPNPIVIIVKTASGFECYYRESVIRVIDALYDVGYYDDDRYFSDRATYDKWERIYNA